MDEVTAGEIAFAGGQSRESISMALLRYHRFGLMNRRRNGSGVYLYARAEPMTVLSVQLISKTVLALVNDRSIFVINSV